MYRSLLVPLDGSAFAEYALPFAVGIARRAGAVLHVVQAHLAVASLYSGSALAADLNLDAALREKEAAYLDGVVKRLKESALVGVSRALVDGPAADALRERALAAAADLVVMATHGRGPLSRLWLGSVADTLVRRLPMPILLVRSPGEPVSPATEHVVRRILIPLDGSDLAEQVLGPATALGSLTGAEYMLVRVVEPFLRSPHESPGPLLDRLAREARAYLDGVAGRLRGLSPRVATRVMINRPAAEAILEDARVHAADLVAVGTHGRGGLARLALGSVADKVIRGALAPVLVHRPRANTKRTPL
jgi:nucleotide-binding universal stress UspA family protein